MNYDLIIFLALGIGFILLAFIIRQYPFGKPRTNDGPSLYYKLDLSAKTITTISLADLNEDITRLLDRGYKFAGSQALKESLSDQKKIPKKSFLFANDEPSIADVTKALPHLINIKSSIVIFIPVFPNNNKFQESQSRLNHFIFSKDFKISVATPN